MEGKSDGVPGEERRAIIPSFSEDGISDLVSEPEESTSVVAAADADDTIVGRRRTILHILDGQQHRADMVYG